MKIDPKKNYKQWAAGYNDPPGPPSEDELDILEREARAEFGPGYQVHGCEVLPPQEARDEAGELLEHKVGLVVFLFEEQE